MHFRLSLGLLLLGALTACGAALDTEPHAPPCDADEYRYEDEQCGATQEGLVCQPWGDGLCYRLCETDEDCGSGTRCALLGLFAGGDGYCNDTVRVCADREDTPCTVP